MTSMQYVKKMVLIPHDEYNSWKESKKVGLNSSHHLDSQLPEPHGNITDSDHSDKIQHLPDHSAQGDKHRGLEPVTDNTYKELVSKIGSTLLDLLVNKGAQSLQNFLGAGELDQVAPPPGEPDAKKPKRLLTEDNHSKSTNPVKIISQTTGTPKDLNKNSHNSLSQNIPQKTGSNTKLTWKHLR